MNNLIERLREESLYSDKCTLEIMDLCMEAASELEEEIKCRKKQADIIEELRGQKHEMISRIDQLKYELEQVKRCIEIVEKQRDSAIEELENYMVQDVLDGNEPCEICAKASDTPCECCDPKWRGPKED